MVDRRELEALIIKVQGTGADVKIVRDVTGYPNLISVTGLKGVGSYPMSPISFAERIREALVR